MGNCICLPTAPPAPTAPTVQDLLALATYENTPEYTLTGLRTSVKILRIIDGDTVDLALAHPDSQRIQRHRVRLWGIDTPEKRPSRSDPHRHLEIEASYRAKEALERRCQENNLLLHALFYHPDKYGRLLCTLYDEKGEDINQWMITEGHAVEYNGKTKKKFQPLSLSSPSSSPSPSSPSPLVL